MKVAFVTTNKHKFQEVCEILQSFPIVLEHHNVEYEENHDSSLEVIAHDAAKKLASKFKQNIVLEDSGLFFGAFEGFPGALPKFVFKTLGYRGILKLLEGETRAAYFKAVVAFARPGEEPTLFEGTMVGKMTTRVFDEEMDVMPYDRIFVPEGETKPISQLSRETKNSLSHRGQAFRRFGKYVAGLG